MQRQAFLGIYRIKGSDCLPRLARKVKPIGGSGTARLGKTVAIELSGQAALGVNPISIVTTPTVSTIDSDSCEQPNHPFAERYRGREFGPLFGPCSCFGCGAVGHRFGVPSAILPQTSGL